MVETDSLYMWQTFYTSMGEDHTRKELRALRPSSRYDFELNIRGKEFRGEECKELDKKLLSIVLADILFEEFDGNVVEDIDIHFYHPNNHGQIFLSEDRDIQADVHFPISKVEDQTAILYGIVNRYAELTREIEAVASGSSEE